MGSKTRCLVLVLMLMAACSHARAQDDPPKWVVDFKPGWNNSYRPERWMPISLMVQAPKIKKPVACTLNFIGQQDSMTNMSLDQDFTVTPNLAANVSTVVKVCHNSSKFDLVIRDAAGRVQWDSQMGSSSVMEAVPLHSLFIGLARSGAPNLLNIGSRITLNSRGNNNEIGRVVVREKVMNLLPWDWTGYDCLDLLILHDLDWNLVNETKARAIAAWVHNGGKLLIVLGSHPLPKDHVLTRLLPFTVGPAKKVTLSSDTLRDWRLLTVQNKLAVTCWDLPAVKGWRKLSLPEGPTYFVHGLVGFGQVGVAAFTPTELSPSITAEYFYADLLAKYGYSCSVDGTTRSDSEDTTENDSTVSVPSSFGSDFEVGPAAKNTDRVLGFLVSIPEMRPLSIWWIIALLSLLAVVLGPLDYFLLKKLDRMPLTWITSAGVIVLFSIGAYYGVERIRGGLMHIRAITVTDAVQGQAGSCWSTTISGIFAPSSDSYRLTGPKYNQWWSSLSPSRQGMSYYRPDREEATRNIYYHQSDGGNLPTAVPINIWSMQCLLTEMQAQALPITVKIEYIREQSEFLIKLDNQSDMDITDAFVRLNVNGRDNLIEVGPVKPHGKTEAISSSRSSSHNVPPEVDFATQARGADARTKALEKYHKQGAAIVYAYAKQAPLPFKVENRQGTENHQHLMRLVVPNVTAVRE